MAVKNSILPIPLTNIASSSVTGSYAAINASGLPNAVCVVRITNASTKDVTISYDGSNDHDYLVSGTVLLLFLQSNSQPNNFIANISKGTVVYVKGTGGTGNIYLAGWYQPQL